MRAGRVVALALALVMGSVGVAVAGPPAAAASVQCEVGGSRWYLPPDRGMEDLVAQLIWCVPDSPASLSKLTNTSPYVWSFTGSIRIQTRSDTAESMAGMHSKNPLGAFILPGETVDIASFDNARVDPDYELTSRWLAFVSINDAMTLWSEAAESTWFERFAPKWNAIWECTSGAYELSQTDTTEPLTLEELIDASVDVKDTSKSCASLLNKKKKPTSASTSTLKPTPTQLKRTAQELTFVDEANDALRTLRQICAASPRC